MGAAHVFSSALPFWRGHWRKKKCSASRLILMFDAVFAAWKQVFAKQVFAAFH